MGRVCGKHQQFVNDGEECNYCEEPARQPSLPTPITKVPLTEMGREFKTPIDMSQHRPNFFDGRFRGPLSESYPEWKARTAAGRLNMAQELLAPKDESGAPLPPLVTVDEAKKLLDLPESPLRPLYLDAEAQKFQQALLDHIEQLKKLVLQAFALPPRNVFERPQSMQDSLRKVFLARGNCYEARYACMFSLAVQPGPNHDATKYEVQAYDGFTDRRGVVIGVVSNVEAYSNKHALDRLLGAVLDAAARKAYDEMKKSAPVAAMEATPPSTREDAHGDQKGTRPR